MIQPRTQRTVMDNSGVRRVRCIARKNAKRNQGHVGCSVLATVMATRPGTTFSRGDKVRGIVVSTAFPERRRDGSWMRMSHAKVILVNKKLDPLASRAGGAVSCRLRARGRTQVLARSKGAY